MKKRSTWVRLVMLLVLAASGTVAGIMACSTDAASGTPEGVKLRDESVTLAVAGTPTGVSPDTCYGFGHACPGPEACCAGERCSGEFAGTCVCATGYTECVIGGSDYCEDLQTDWQHCGTCGNECITFEGSHESCISGVCRVPAGWLYTNYQEFNYSTGTGGYPWMGRGVNVDDLFLGGGNNPLGRVPDAGGTLQTLIATVISQWKPTFLRISLGMDSYPNPVSWVTGVGDAATYKTPMTQVITSIASQGVYVLVSLRSDTSMTQTYGEGSDIPTPTTDAVYKALVDSFSSSPYVMFGISNEPGGQTMEDAGAIASVMSHAVYVIRTEENRLVVPHHIVAVQGTNYTHNIYYYNTAPLVDCGGLPCDNVVYEYHGYEPMTTTTPPNTYLCPNIPVIVGEYGPQQGSGGSNWDYGDPVVFDAGGFYQNVEANKIPNLAWDMEPFSDDSPDLVYVTGNTGLDASTWGAVVKTYLGDPDAY
jgi:hypothetical protein